MREAPMYKLCLSRFGLTSFVSSGSFPPELSMWGEEDLRSTSTGDVYAREGEPLVPTNTVPPARRVGSLSLARSKVDRCAEQTQRVTLRVVGRAG